MFNTTTTTSQQRSAFADDDVSTASPRRILVKCFDRLDLDLSQALAAIEENDPETTNRVLRHAQDLLGEVATMLDTAAWEHADGLLSVYDYVLRLIAVGNIHKAPAPIAESRMLLADIGNAFREASQSIDRDAVAAATAAAAVAPSDTNSSARPDQQPAATGGSFSTFA